jgi:hypothetical protein
MKQVNKNSFSKIPLVLIIAAIALVVIISDGCKKEDIDNNSNDALNGNILSGRISNWELGSGYYVRAATEGNYGDLVGGADISSDGSFSIKLQNPIADELEQIVIWNSDEELTISDPTSKGAQVEYLRIRDSQGFVGTMYRESLLNEYAKGYAFVQYYYISKETTVKGEILHDEVQVSIDLIFKEGWNTVSFQLTDIKSNSNTTTYYYKISNFEPSSVVWHFYQWN